MADLTFTAKNFSGSLNGYEVRRGGKLLGRIVQDAGWVFQPKGKYRDARFWSRRYSTLTGCKGSLLP